MAEVEVSGLAPSCWLRSLGIGAGGQTGGDRERAGHGSWEKGLRAARQVRAGGPRQAVWARAAPGKAVLVVSHH